MDSVEPDGIIHQRNSDGRFAPGNTVGKGRDKRETQRRLRDAVMAEVAPEELAEIIRRQVEYALTGDLKAAVFVRDTLLGKPQAPKETSASERKMLELRDIMEEAIGR